MVRLHGNPSIQYKAINDINLFEPVRYCNLALLFHILTCLELIDSCVHIMNSSSSAQVVVLDDWSPSTGRCSY